MRCCSRILCDVVPQGMVLSLGGGCWFDCSMEKSVSQVLLGISHFREPPTWNIPEERRISRQCALRDVLRRNPEYAVGKQPVSQSQSVVQVGRPFPSSHHQPRTEQVPQDLHLHQPEHFSVTTVSQLGVSFNDWQFPKGTALRILPGRFLQQYVT